MHKIIPLIIFSLIFVFLPGGFLSASSLIELTNNGAPSSTIYQSEFDKLVMDFTIQRSDNAADILSALTLENSRTARNYYDISKVVVWADSGEAGFQGMGIDEKLGEATYYGFGDYWYLSEISRVVPEEGLRLFVSVETAARGYVITGKTIQMQLSALLDLDASGEFDVGDSGVFLEGVAGTTEGLLNSEIQTITVLSSDSSAPKTVVTAPQSDEIISDTSYVITGATRDQGGSNPSEVKVSITKDGEEESDFVNVTATGDNFLTWEYDWEGMSEGVYTIKAYATDWIGNTEIVGDGVTVTVDQSVLNTASGELSLVEADTTDILSDGVDKALVTVTVKNSFSELLSSKEVALSSSREEDSVVVIKNITGEDGVATFEVSSTVAGEAVLTASADSVEFDQNIILNFEEVSIRAGDLIKGKSSSVYFYSQNGKKYLFPTSAIYSSWYEGYGSIKTVSSSELNAKSTGGNVTVRPGKLVQFVSMDTPWQVMDPKVYAVASGGTLHWLTTAQVASSIFGSSWEGQISPVPEVFKTNYSFGGDISSAGDYDLTLAESVTSIDEEVGFNISAFEITAMFSGDLVKGSGSAVYYYGADGKKYLFPTSAIYSSWYEGYGSIKTVSSSELNAKSTGGNVTVRPGKLVQFVSMDTPWQVMDPKVYAVASGGTLHWLTTAQVASSIFGSSWEGQISPVPEVFKTNYSFGGDLNSSSDYNLSTQQAITTINQDKNLTSSSSGSSGTVGTGLIQPSDLVYQGAFRLPDGSNGTSWEYSGTGVTYYPGGDSTGSSDGYPGSLFATGHEWEQQISEISIPVPVNSGSKNVSELNTASTLQSFRDIKGDMFGYLELPRVGLAYLPQQGSQASDKIYFCWAQHLDEGNNAASHGWFDLNLSNPNTQGPWRIAGQTHYVTADYMFDIPEAWADRYVGGRMLGTGRYRDGGQGSQGPTIFALSPWEEGNPPATNASLSSTPLLQYSTVYYYDDPSGARAMSGYSHADHWSGAAWLTKDDKAAVIFSGVKGVGNTWYGYYDGTVWPEEGPFPPEGPGERGWWSDSFAGQIIFYDPSDLADVAEGRKEPHEPQPYATLNIDEFLYSIPENQIRMLGDLAFDRENGIIYLFEYLGDADLERSLVHVWKVN